MSTETAIKKYKPSHLKDLLLLFAVPAGIALLAAIVIYTPRLFANPKYDFLYTYCDSYGCRDDYHVDESGFVIYDGVKSPDDPYNTRDNGLVAIRYYDVDTDSSKAISLEEAQKYELNTSSRSPDGYTLGQEKSGGGFLFWGDYEQGWYLKDGPKKKGVNLSISSPSYADHVEFLGWIMPQ